jgi:transketolase
MNAEIPSTIPAASRDEPGVNSLRFLSVEAGMSQGWHRYVGSHDDVRTVDRFRASAAGELMMREYGFTVDYVCTRPLALLETPP